MTALALCLVVFAVLVHLAGIAVACWRCRPPRGRTPPPPDAPSVTVIRPVCGDEYRLEETLSTTFALDYPRCEAIFCAASANDPAVATVRRLIAANPQARARLLIGNEAINDNPKLNNLLKGWRAARTDWVVMADSNVLMPPDYVQRLLAAWLEDTALVCAPPVGSDPQGFWAEVECAFLNTFQARWQYTADFLGLGFAQGKTMLWRRRDLERWGGIGRLAAELAEDAAATKLIRAHGRSVHLADAPFAQPLGRRSAAEVWRRQARWARLRRVSFPGWYALEIFTSGLWPVLAAALAAAGGGADWRLAPAVAVLWYGGEAVLARLAGWPLRLRSPAAALTRDLAMPALWVSGWVGTQFVWRGNLMRTAESGSAP